ncbi:unnamed protein product, partial [Brassica oleracea]
IITLLKLTLNSLSLWFETHTCSFPPLTLSWFLFFSATTTSLQLHFLRIVLLQWRCC